MRQVMKKVIIHGTGKKAAVSGYTVGGKTGTAQKLDSNGAYSHDYFIASFAGFLQYKGDQMLTISVSIDDPRPVYYGGSVAAPLFSEIAGGIMDYWQIDRSESVHEAKRP